MMDAVTGNSRRPAADFFFLIEILPIGHSRVHDVDYLAVNEVLR